MLTCWGSLDTSLSFSELQLPFCSKGHPWSLTPVLSSFPGGSVGKESACTAGDPSSIPELGKSPGEGNGNPLQYSCLGNPMDRGAWQAIVHWVARVGYDLAAKPPPPLSDKWMGVSIFCSGICSAHSCHFCSCSIVPSQEKQWYWPFVNFFLTFWSFNISKYSDSNWIEFSHIYSPQHFIIFIKNFKHAVILIKC